MLHGAVGCGFAGSRNRDRRAIGVEQAEKLRIGCHPRLRADQADHVTAFDFADIGQRTVAELGQLFRAQLEAFLAVAGVHAVTPIP